MQFFVIAAANGLFLPLFSLFPSPAYTRCARDLVAGATGDYYAGVTSFLEDRGRAVPTDVCSCRVGGREGRGKGE